MYAWAQRGALPGSGASATAPSLQDLQLTQLTTSGNADGPAISSDGKYVAYVQHDSNGDSLWVRQTATSSNVRRSCRRSRASRCSARPSRRTVVMWISCAVTERSLSSCGASRFSAGTPKRIVDSIGSLVAWSPDGLRMAFVRDLSKAGLSPLPESTALITADPDGSREQMLAVRRKPSFFNITPIFSAVQQPAWSPSGATIALLASDGSSRAASGRGYLVAVDVATGAERIFPVTGVSTIAWLDDASLVLSRRAEQSAALQLWRLSYPEGKLSRLTNDLNSYAGVSVTGDGRGLVTAQRVTRVGIWVGDRAGDTRRRSRSAGAGKKGRRRLGGRPPRLYQLHPGPAIDRQRSG